VFGETLLWAGGPAGLATGVFLAWWLGRVAINRLRAHGRCAAGRFDKLSELRVGRLDLLVDHGDLGDQLRGQLPAGASDDVAWSHGVKQGSGLRRGQELLRPARHELQQELVQPVEYLGAGPAQTVTAVDEQLQRDRGVIDGDLPQTGRSQGGDSHAVGVGRVGLASLVGVEQPDPCGQLRR